MIEIIRTRKKGKNYWDYMTRREHDRCIKNGQKFSNLYSLGFFKSWDHFWREKDNESSSIEEHHESQ